METLQKQPFYQKGVNCGSDVRDKLVGSDNAPSCRNISSSEKRDAIYSMDTLQFCRLIQKIRDAHASVSSKLANSFMNPDGCDQLLKPHMDGWAILVLFLLFFMDTCARNPITRSIVFNNLTYKPLIISLI